MTVELSDIRTGLVNNITATIGGTVGQVSGYRLANPTPPAILVTGWDQIARNAFGSARFQIDALVQALAGATTDKHAQIRLDAWLSPVGATSLWLAIESDPTLGGKALDVTVLGCDGTQIVTLDNGTEVLASTLHVQVDL